MAQCGGICVRELNKLEVDLCDRLRWRLTPPLAELEELRAAVRDPHAAFWADWYNAPRPAAAVAGGGRLPHAKSLQGSLGRFFGAAAEGERDGAPAPAQAGEVPAVGKTPSQASAMRPAAAPLGKRPPAAEGSPTGSSPRTVMGQRTFSLSNLFGMTSWS